MGQPAGFELVGEMAQPGRGDPDEAARVVALEETVALKAVGELVSDDQAQGRAAEADE